jgi:hypothetical protein
MEEIEAVFPLKEIREAEKDYKRLHKIEILLQQYLFCCEFEDEGPIKEKIKEIIESRLKRLGATNEDRLVALYRLEMPYKAYETTKRMIEYYEKIANKEEVKERLQKLSIYEDFISLRKKIELM